MVQSEESLSLRTWLIDQGHRLRMEIWAAHNGRNRIEVRAEVRGGSLFIVQCTKIPLTRALVEKLVHLCYDRIQRERLLFGAEQDRAAILKAERWLQRQLQAADATQIIEFFQK